MEITEVSLSWLWYMYIYLCIRIFTYISPHVKDTYDFIYTYNLYICKVAACTYEKFVLWICVPCLSLSFLFAFFSLLLVTMVIYPHFPLPSLFRFLSLFCNLLEIYFFFIPYFPPSLFYLLSFLLLRHSHFYQGRYSRRREWRGEGGRKGMGRGLRGEGGGKEEVIVIVWRSPSPSLLPIPLLPTSSILLLPLSHFPFSPLVSHPFALSLWCGVLKEGKSGGRHFVRR